MGENHRRKLLKPKKIRTRSDQEIAAVVIAYRNLYKDDPFKANLMVLMSELSEYILEIQMEDAEKLRVFIEKNWDGLLKQFLRRFPSIDHCAIPLESLDSSVRIKGTDWIN